MQKPLLTIVIWLSLFLSLIMPVSAQTITPDLTIDSIPLNPGPLSTVQLEARSYALNLDQATITWRYNDKIIDNGIGRKRATVTTPASGQIATITVTVAALGSPATTATITFRPASVDILWEAADSYTPPFFKGKALPSDNSLIRVAAIPAFNAPKNASFNWVRNNAALPSASGYNKSTILIKHNELNQQEQISVTASGGTFSGNGSVTITPRQPSLIGYSKIEGFVDYANGSTNILSTTRPGMVVWFEPFYFSAPNGINADLTISATENDSPIPSTDNKNEFRFSRPEGGGQAKIRLAISTMLYSLQYLERTFTLNFN